MITTSRSACDKTVMRSSGAAPRVCSPYRSAGGVRTRQTRNSDGAADARTMRTVVVAAATAETVVSGGGGGGQRRVHALLGIRARVVCGGVRSLATAAGVDVYNASVPVVSYGTTVIIIYSGFHDVPDTCAALASSNAFYGKFFSDDDHRTGVFARKEGSERPVMINRW